MADNTIHDPDLLAVTTILRGVMFFISLQAVLSDSAVIVLLPDNRYNLKRWVRGLESHLVLGEHVPVNPAALAFADTLAASDLYEHRHILGSVFLIETEMGPHLQFASVELFRPMTLFTRLPRRPQVLDGRWDRFRVGLEKYGNDLSCTGKF